MRILKTADPKVRGCFRLVPVGFSLRIAAGMDQRAPSVTLVNGKTKIVRNKGKAFQPHVIVTFKSPELAYQTLTGKMSISDAYARHAIYLKGNLNEAMAFFRAMEYVEAYLFSETTVKRILKRMPKKQISRFRTYVRIIFSD